MANQTLFVKIGDKYGLFTVIREVKPEKFNSGDTKRMIRCKCQCGKIKNVRLYYLTKVSNANCGCLRFKIMSNTHKTHGLTNHPIFRVWSGMINRCHNERGDYYKNYGGRGIFVCQEWRDDFLSFYRWSLANGYKRGLQIDRIENNMGYYPENCRYVTSLINNNNRRSSKRYEYNGQMMPLKEICKIEKMRYTTVFARMRLGGLTLLDALNIKYNRNSNVKLSEPPYYT